MEAQVLIPGIPPPPETSRRRRVRRFTKGWRYRLALWLHALADAVNPLPEKPCP
jgi:hypothetical protein